eukprot:c4185_g1_i1.p1 GENE.c4185_g1_i1~~c4185_g1_i1.p1  ORF type:complete len:225 (-),score=53.74 c4185_g1_i1:104-778(-)
MRPDGRDWNQIRPLSCEQTLLRQADGSVRLKNGDTTVIASVSGPRQAKQHQELVDRAAVQVIVKPKSGIPGGAEREMERTLRLAFEYVIITTLHPRTLIQIVIQIITDDGALLSTCFNACTIALSDCGVPLRSLLCSVTCALTADGQYLLDPTLEEEKSNVCIIHGAFVRGDPTEISYLRTFGNIQESQLDHATFVTMKATECVFAFIDTVAQKRLGALAPKPT